MTLTVHVPRRRPRPVDVVVEWSVRSTVARALCRARGAPRRAGAAAELPGAGAGVRHRRRDAAAPARRLRRGRQRHAPRRPPGPAARADPARARPRRGRRPGCRPQPPAVASRCRRGSRAGRRSRRRRRSPEPQPCVRRGGAARRHGGGLRVHERHHGRRGPGPVGDGGRRAVGDRGRVVDPAASAGGRGRAAGTAPRRRDGAPEPHERTTAWVSGDVEIRCPTAPPERHRGRVPWIAAIAPVPVAIALAVFLGPQLLLFAALGPVSLLAGALGDRWGSGRAHRREVAAHAVAVTEARGRLGDALRSEAERLDRAHPDPAAVLVTAEQRGAALWRGGGSARVRLGSGAVPTRVAWVEGSSRTHPAVARAPLVVDLAEVGCLGVVGSDATVDGLLAGLVGQLCTAHAPHELVGLGRLVRAGVVVGGPPAARCRRSGGAVGCRRLGPAAHRRAHPRSRSGRSGCWWCRGRRPGTGALVQAALGAGVLVVAGAPSRAELPPGCGGVVARLGAEHVYDGAAGRVVVRPRPGRALVVRPPVAGARAAALLRPHDERPDAVAAHPRRRPRRNGAHGGAGGRGVAVASPRPAARWRRRRPPLLQSSGQGRTARS